MIVYVYIIRNIANRIFCTIMQLIYILYTEILICNIKKYSRIISHLFVYNKILFSDIKLNIR